jgi:photosystem II stability/assembly factor-like uncharacterized protein
MWTSIAPTTVVPPNAPQNFNAGRVSSIAVDPGNPDHWVIGTGNGGVWASRDRGGSWQPLTDAAPTLAIGAVAFAPSDPSIIYAATGEAVLSGFAKAGVGILKSTDGGQTWNLLAASSFARASVRRVRVHPLDANIVLAASSRGGFGRDSQEGAPSPPPLGVQKSTDGGVTWARTLPGQATALEIDSSNFNNLYAAIGEIRRGGVANDTPGAAANGLYRSTDQGHTWTLVEGPWSASSARPATGRIELAMSPSHPNVLYASIAVSPDGGSSAQPLLGLYRTDDAWATRPTWIQVPTGPTGEGGYCGPTKCNYAHVISVDPMDPNTLFAGGGSRGGGVFRCTSCGSSPQWANVSNTSGVHPDHHAMAWAGNRLIDGNDGGVWSTVNRGSSWQNHNRTFSTIMFFGAALHPTDPDIILAGIRDHALALRPRAGVWWTLPQPASANVDASVGEWGEAEVAVSSRHPDTDWMAAWLWGAISRTLDGGKTGTPADRGIDKTGAAFVAPVRKCPANDDVFLTGTNRMWRTNNFFGSGMPTWTANGPSHPFQFPNSIGAPGTILSIEFAPSDPGCSTYAFGNRGGEVQLTRDGGTTWRDLDPGRSLPPRPVNWLAFDSTNPNVLYAALSSFDIATPGKGGHVFKTTNALSDAPSWVNVGPPEDVPFNVVAVDPSDARVVYAGSDVGLWRSVDAAATWVRMGPDAGLPHAPIYDIKINSTTKRTIVFTYGRGAFALDEIQPSSSK